MFQLNIVNAIISSNDVAHSHPNDVVVVNVVITVSLLIVSWHLRSDNGGARQCWLLRRRIADVSVCESPPPVPFKPSFRFPPSFFFFFRGVTSTTDSHSDPSAVLPPDCFLLAQGIAVSACPIPGCNWTVSIVNRDSAPTPRPPPCPVPTPLRPRLDDGPWPWQRIISLMPVLNFLLKRQ